MQSNTPVVLLQEIGGARRTLPIFIGTSEATAIAYALQGVETPRPMTHDLMRDMLSALGATLDRVVVTELVARTYYAELHMTLGARRITVSSRPSDALALAARTGAPLSVADDLMDAEGVVLAESEEDEEETPENSEELVNEFQRFLDTVRPEDFGSS